MESISRIVVPLSGQQDHERAVHVGAAVARRIGVPLLLVQQREPGRSLHLDVEYLERLAAHQLVVDTQFRLVEGFDPAAMIVALAADPSQLVCLAAAPHHLLVPGSVTAAVLRFAAHPVLLVGPGVHHGWSSLIDTVVAPIDGSAASEMALTTAGQVASFCQAALDVVQVLDPHDAASAGALGSDTDESAYARAQAHRVVTHGTVTWDVLHGKPGRAIVEHVAAMPRPLVVMSAYGQSGGQHMLGRVTHHVLHEGSSPVLVVRPPNVLVVSPVAASAVPTHVGGSS